MYFIILQDTVILVRFCPSCSLTFLFTFKYLSYSAVKSNRSQLTEQIHSLERDFGKTASTIKEMENTIVSCFSYVPFSVCVCVCVCSFDEFPQFIRNLATASLLGLNQ